MVAICLICNASLDSPEQAKTHIDKTLHEQFEMAPSFKKFKKDFELSFNMYKQKNEDWKVNLEQEFNQIFDNEKAFQIYFSKIEKCFENG